MNIIDLAAFISSFLANDYLFVLSGIIVFLKIYLYKYEVD